MILRRKSLVELLTYKDIINFTKFRYYLLVFIDHWNHQAN
jgi:hypothetical protein